MPARGLASLVLLAAPLVVVAPTDDLRESCRRLQGRVEPLLRHKARRRASSRAVLEPGQPRHRRGTRKRVAPARRHGRGNRASRGRSQGTRPARGRAAHDSRMEPRSGPPSAGRGPQLRPPLRHRSRSGRWNHRPGAGRSVPALGRQLHSSRSLPPPSTPAPNTPARQATCSWKCSRKDARPVRGGNEQGGCSTSLED